MDLTLQIKPKMNKETPTPKTIKILMENYQYAKRELASIDKHHQELALEHERFKGYFKNTKDTLREYIREFLPVEEIYLNHLNDCDCDSEFDEIEYNTNHLIKCL